MNSVIKLIKAYKMTALICFNVLLFFLCLNVFAAWYVESVLNRASEDENEITIKYGNDAFSDVYPGYSRKDVNQLLNECWKRPFLYEPFTQFTERPVNGMYVHFDERGFRVVKDQGPWPPAEENCNIFVFGGSTTFGYGVTDNQTIASYLQEQLQQRYAANVRVYNFGRGHFYSTQESILLQRLILTGTSPDIAVFIDGLNEFAYTNDRPVFTDKFEKAAQSVVSRRQMLQQLPIVELFRAIIANTTKVRKTKEWRGENAAAFDNEKKYNDTNVISRVVSRYRKNKTFIEAFTATYDIQPVFVWQPVPGYKYDLRHHLFFGPSVVQHYSRYGYPYMARVIKEQGFGNNFIWCADLQLGLAEPLYVDSCHYSASMSERFAASIADALINKNLLPCAADAVTP